MDDISSDEQSGQGAAQAHLCAGEQTFAISEDQSLVGKEFEMVAVVLGLDATDPEVSDQEAAEPHCDVGGRER